MDYKKAYSTYNKIFFTALLGLFLMTYGCGGGGSSGSGVTAGSEDSGYGSGPAASGVISLNWNAPTTNADGSPLTDLGGFKVYYGTSSGYYESSVDVGNTTSFTLSSLPSGSYCFALTAYDTARNESGYSPEVCKTVTPG